MGEAKISLGGDMKYQSKVFFSEFNNRDAVQGSYVLFNASAAYHSPNDQWTLTGWVKNLTNKFIIANNIIAAATYAYPRVGSLMPPRTYGATLGFNF